MYQLARCYGLWATTPTASAVDVRPEPINPSSFTLYNVLYLRLFLGRIRLAQINQIVDKFNEVLNKKYSVVEQSLKGACRENKEKYLRYKSQEISETKHQRFCMDEDIKENFSSKEIQTFNKQVVQILRHCKRIKEIRNGILVRYVLLPH